MQNGVHEIKQFLSWCTMVRKYFHYFSTLAVSFLSPPRIVLFPSFEDDRSSRGKLVCTLFLSLLPSPIMGNGLTMDEEKAMKEKQGGKMGKEKRGLIFLFYFSPSLWYHPMSCYINGVANPTVLSTKRARERRDSI